MCLVNSVLVVMPFRMAAAASLAVLNARASRFNVFQLFNAFKIFVMFADVPTFFNL